MKKKYLLLFLIAGMSLSAIAQSKDSEKLVYAASYNMQGLMTQLAQVTFETKKVNTSKSTFLHLRMDATTFKKWDTYFKVRDLFESYVNPQTLMPSLYKRNTFEGNYSKTEKYVYQSGGRSIKSTSQRQQQPVRENTIAVSAGTIDVITLFHKIRMTDFSKHKPGATIPFKVVFDEKEFPITVKYMGKETISAGRFGKKECYKISLAAAKTDVLKGTDKNIVWITADSQHLPLLLRFSIPVGTGQLELTEVK